MAQVSASVSLQSDYRYRGLSLSDGRPTLGLAVAYDHPSGLYAGGQAIAQDTRHDGVRMLGLVEYAGYAARGPAGLSFDVGIDNQDYGGYDADSPSQRYSEIYAGVTRGGLSLHAYYSPDYLRPGRSTVYIDLSGAIHPVESWRLFGHIGAMAPIGGAGANPSRIDARVGIAREFRHFEIDVAATGVSRNASTVSSATPTALTLGASCFF